MRTEQQLGRVHAAMTLLFVRMAEVTPPIHEELDSWIRVLQWLSDVVADLESNLTRSLQHNALQATAGQVQQ
ncbi:hypothetical protein [Lichenicoccus roseus]|uniref:Uncharacterized protein n=1 Tax=Lichenicoccus roseus TaxID=2683649 RepID=A0A5R9J3D0_9PROT|nr:hypothetical protein [Lichenicoccus roseus]TLU71479.1 hypothetical protein FE263_16405 [Lichenicoccus roseus]